jgi:DNA-binding response OmpR family regulator
LAELKPVAGSVIVVESDPLVRMLLEEMLDEIGFSSEVFDNAGSALTHLKRIKGDCTLIIADQGLPGGIPGSEFIRLANEQWPSAPSILTSGYLIEDQVIPPSTFYLRKPYTLSKLETTIATVLRQRTPLPHN